MSATISDADLAAHLGITEKDVREGCATKGWPHLRPKRTVWRFTPAQVAEIENLLTVRKKQAVDASPFAGQTPRSKRTS